MSTLPLWSVVGTGKSGGICRMSIRAATHDDAVKRAQSMGCVNVVSCVLQEPAP